MGARLEDLEPLVGDWDVTMAFPPSSGFPEMHARETFTWMPGGGFLVLQSETDHEAAPNGLCLIGVDGEDPERFVQHYFDSRGVARIYRMTFDGKTWTLLRTEPDFTSLEFSQRFVGTLSDDGDTIDGRYEQSHDGGGTWELDFHATFRRSSA